MTYDLGKLEEKFWQFINADEYYDKNEIRITEELLTQVQTLFIPFGHMRYFLAIEDEKPVIYAHVSSRMDMKRVFLIDEDGWKGFDVNGPGKNEDMLEKYHAHLRSVNRSGSIKGFRKTEK